MNFFHSRASWTGSFSKTIGSMRPGCQGSLVNNEYGQPCPSDTWTNGTWKRALGAPYLQFWNERRIRRNLEFWTDPAFGKYTKLEAMMDAARVPRSARIVNPAWLKRAFDVFSAMYPERPRWRLQKGLIHPANRVFLDQRKAIDEFGIGAVLGRFFHFFEPATSDWRISSPAVTKAYEDAKRYLGLRTQAMVDAWYAKAHALIAEVPGSADDLNVQHEWNMIIVRPGSVEVHPWIFKFLDLFGRSQFQFAVSPAQVRATAPKLTALVAKK